MLSQSLRYKYIEKLQEERVTLKRSRCMEPLQDEIIIDDVSFTKSQVFGMKGKNVCCYKQLEMPESPIRATDFHSRFWSPSASHHFLQIFTTNNSLLPNDTNEEDDENFRSAHSTPKASLKQDNNIEMDSQQRRTWPRGQFLSSLFRWRNESKKEERRLQTAQLHAALSLTQLAAAIAGISSTTGKEEGSPFQQGTPCQDMANVLSSAAALVTNVCAEAAESLGANRAEVQAAVDSGVAIQTPIDMIAITATAATCLRGASLLKTRATAVPLSRVQEMLKISAEIRTIMPSGRKECTRVSVYLKHQHLIFCFTKKYLRGALTSTKEYQVTNITQERREQQGNCLLCLNTKNGVIKLLFEDEMQSKIWISTILNLLEVHNIHKY
ncbi:uncharacterized protein LOC131018880 [Salvia miltiorrhiza]|uniref:uncharacterized protein LOC131018880 n=1 Tax=Salvia miltiorrhiza TaxID=226208 RepID=UPI0025AC9EE7|nr:uncharacterized protein LOC131018880 [Salvia miltiorrhiza]